MGFIGLAAMSLVFLSGQEPQLPPGNVCGVIQDQTGAAIAGAPAELSAGQIHLDTKTNSAGQFCFNHVEPGEYELTLRARGFRTNQQKVIVHAGESVHLAISLSLEAVIQQVTVAEGSADAGSLNVAQTQVRSGLLHGVRTWLTGQLEH